MLRDLAKDIATSLKEKLEANNLTIIHNNTSHSFSQDNFSQIPNPSLSSSNQKIAFIDGGNAELLTTPSLSLQFIRICGIVYKNNKPLKRLKQEFFMLAYPKSHNNKLHYHFETFSKEEQNSSFPPLSFPPIALDEKALRTGDHNLSPQAAISQCRKHAELLFSKSLLPFLDLNDSIVLDGDLDDSNIPGYETTRVMQDITNTKSLTLTALAKTSRILTEGGSSALFLLKKSAPKNTTWSYQITPTTHITKLHPKAKHLFRLDIHQNKEASKEKVAQTTNTLLSSLAKNAKDPIFPGYPYGLIEVDKFARVSNAEANTLKAFFFHKIKSEFPDLEELKDLLNAHSILDSMSF